MRRLSRRERLLGSMPEAGEPLLSSWRALSTAADTDPLQLWLTHKELCGRNVDEFYAPPLTPDELDELEALKGEDLPGGHTAFSAITGCSPQAPIDDTVWVVRCAANTSPTTCTAHLCPRRTQAHRDLLVSQRSANADTEESRIAAVCNARSILLGARCAAPRTPAEGLATATPWQLIGNRAWWLRSMYYSVLGAEGVRDPIQAAGNLRHCLLSVFNRVLRRHLVLATICAQARPPDPQLSEEERYRWSVRGKRQAIRDLEGIHPLAEPVRAYIRASLIEDAAAEVAARAAEQERDLWK